MTPSTPPTSETVWSERDLDANPHRAEDKAARVQRMFAAIARSYDLNNRVHSFGRDQAWRRRAVRAANVRPTDDVLDAACGTGDLSEAFARSGARSVVGVDFTAAMLELARYKAERERSRSASSARVPIRYDQGDVTRLPYDDASFDIVSIAFGIRNVQEPARAIAEFHRVLRPGGRLIVLEFGRPGNPVIRFGNDLYTKHIMPWTATLIARDRSGAYRYLPRSIDTFVNEAQMQAMLRETGFSDLSAARMTFGVCLLHRGVKPA